MLRCMSLFCLCGIARSVRAIKTTEGPAGPTLTAKIRTSCLNLKIVKYGSPWIPSRLADTPSQQFSTILKYSLTVKREYYMIRGITRPAVVLPLMFCSYRCVNQRKEVSDVSCNNLFHSFFKIILM
jgi:hypothetical protein